MSSLKASHVRTRRRVNELLGATPDLPINVEAIARASGADVRFMDIAQDLAGILYWESGRRIIVVNSGHDLTRQRVSIARQLGFLTLHRRQEVRVDEGLRLALDDPFTGTTETIEEVEASMFALHLLMPAEAMGATLAGLPVDFNDEPTITAIAAKFCVPVSVLVVRCLTLHN